MATVKCVKCGRLGWSMVSRCTNCNSEVEAMPPAQAVAEEAARLLQELQTYDATECCAPGPDGQTCLSRKDDYSQFCAVCLIRASAAELTQLRERVRELQLRSELFAEQAKSQREQKEAAESERDALREQLRAKAEEWRIRARAIIEDVNDGNAPVFEADYSNAWLDCADELDALLSSPVSPQRTQEGSR